VNKQSGKKKPEKFCTYQHRIILIIFQKKRKKKENKIIK
jgi:hypothetical protein